MINPSHQGLVVAISSRALFDFEEENRLFETHDDHAYMALQLERLNEPAPPGVAFSLVKKLLAFNEPHQHRVDVIMVSRNDPVSGLRVYRSAAHYGLSIQRGAFTRGRPPWRYLLPFGVHLFLSTHPADVREAIQAKVPAAQVYPNAMHASLTYPHELRIAFDGDAVIFSDEAERIFQTQGLAAFVDHERNNAHQPLADGPFRPFLDALQHLQALSLGGHGTMRLRTALVTARSAPAHERAIRTLMQWHIQIDEALFLGGLPKAAFLAAFEPDFFFDDQMGHIHAAATVVPSGLVVSGVTHEVQPLAPS